MINNTYSTLAIKKIVFTGGGTAGHVMPNLALMPFLSEFELHYVGCPDSVEERLVKKYAPRVTFHAIEATKFQRGSLLKNLALPFKLLSSKKEAKKLLKQLKPDLIFSKGGFVALPLCLASKNTPIIMHESDFSFGLANRLAKKKCSIICTSFSDLAYKTENAVHTGSPLRQEIYSGNKAVVEKLANFSNTKKNLLIIGGSSGATAINNAVFDSLDNILNQFNVVHITGKNWDKKIIKPNYYSTQFVENIADFFDWANFTLTRGGANALFELIALNIPSLVIPLPKGVSRGDQVLNANYFENLGCVEILNQETLESNKNTLVSALTSLQKNSATLITNMKSQTNIDGTKKIASLIIKTVLQ
ncbi:MAG: UDP-N-acetylglucosamine--N-acetylmuramyl-(pentapeptide) pyrophosphoryl-undecaprenol N-acetylglucosamine transferase [Firmicutes bacterium]|nr:UDP-N-acetylglucosamine--N-acetylmuramyl-(pentapeptide) pyrophosphoryl-undecaprenol N-acetylglucosamine transferase [Bacillota bacterium]